MFKQFVQRTGREPMTPSEWMSIQNSAVNYLNKTKGVPPGPQKPPFQGWKPEVIQGGKGIEDLLKKGDVKKGVAPKTKLSTLEGKKQKLDTAINKEEWIARQKQKNKEAIERFKAKTQKKTVEDFRDDGDLDPGGMAGGGLAYMLGEPNTRTEALQEFGVVTDPWGMYTDPSLYAQGERSSGVPSRAEYKEGGVGQGPWTMGQGARTPDQPEQNLDTPPPQVMGTPDPLKMPQGIPSAAPKSMDPRVMQQQIMQKAMMGQQRPRMGMKEGGTWKTPTTRDVVEKIILSQKYPDPEKLLPHDHALNFLKEGIGLYFLGGPKYGFSKIFGDTVGKAIGKRQHRRHKEGHLAHAMDEADERFQDTGDYDERAGFAGGGMSRRAFMKLMSGLAALPLIGKGVQKAAPKAIKEVTKTIARDAEGVPTYVYDLIEVVKAKGTRDIIEGFKKSDYSTVHSYKGVDVIEEANGTTRIKKQHESGGHYQTDEGVDEAFDGITHEIEMDIRPQYREQYDPETGLSWYKNEKGKNVYEQKIPDEYAEYTARPDMDGKLKEVDEGIDDLDHLDLKEIADEIDTLHTQDHHKTIRRKKASGGLAHMLGE